jgi:hypothetical protein
VFSLEVLAARHGDALLLHHGSSTTERSILVDGGPAGTYRHALLPRLDELRRSRSGDGPLSLDLLMVSHVDDDHINGILALFDAESKRVDERQPPTFKAAGLWANVFDDNVFDDVATETTTSMHASMAAALASGPDRIELRDSAAVIASIPQGRRLRDGARRLGIPLNRPYDGGLVVSNGGVSSVSFGDLRLRTIGPIAARLDALKRHWQRYLAARAKNDAEAMAQAAAYVDRSVFNLSSIVVLATHGDRSMLLTGDARGDDICEGLALADLLDKGSLHVDLMKVPHHGSSANVTEEFFRKVTADRYVISGDGKHDNPDEETLAMLRAARPGADYCLYFTYPVPHVVDFVEQSRRMGERFEVVFRPADSISIDVDVA